MDNLYIISWLEKKIFLALIYENLKEFFG